MDLQRTQVDLRTCSAPHTTPSLILPTFWAGVARLQAAQKWIPRESLRSIQKNHDMKDVRNKLSKSGQKMVLTTFSSALVSELDIVLLGLFFGGPLLGVLSWARRILEILFQLVAASLKLEACGLKLAA